MTTDVTTAVANRVEVFGVRHHGPGSARSLVAALEAYRPDAVLVEGPADADRLIGWAGTGHTQPPVALLAYAPERPSVAAFWPFAVFSPEWQAITWALASSVAVRFCDLPAANTLARQPEEATDDLLAAARPTPDDEPERRRLRRDPLAAMAEAAGYDDPERWWDDVIESRRDAASPFPALTEVMGELRLRLPETDRAEALVEARREAYMRQVIRAELKAGRARVAVVCGAWHAPALTPPLPPAVADARILRGMSRRKVTCTWVPWTHQRLATASGYGAGITSPGWYHHLWSAPDHPIARWLTKVAVALRAKDLVVSSAHVIEAVRLAETLAVLRGRPLAGLTEVGDATLAVLCDGDEVALRYVTEDLVVGQALGVVDERVPTVPLEADLTTRCRSLRIRRDATPKLHDLDLRKPLDRQRSVLFHRLRALEIDWIRPAETQIASRGTFRETWQSQWRPELSIALVEAATWGTTVEAAASSRLIELSGSAGLVGLTDAVERCLLAELPTARDRLLAALADRAARDADVVHLMDALPPLARAQRYGDVRGTDVTALAEVGETLLVRICAGLPQAVRGLDEDSARSMRQRLDAVHAAIGLVESDPPPGGPAGARWLAVLREVVDRPDLPPVLQGRAVRILHDAGRLGNVPERVHRALSYGVAAAAKAGWVDGFFSDGALVLIHDAELLGVLDAWVSGLTDSEFTDVLPLVRRTFATFTGPERRSIAERVTADPGRSPPQAEPEPDTALTEPVLATVSLILRAGERP